MYNKIIELCDSINHLSYDELEENGIRAIMICCIDTNFNGSNFAKGDAPDILSMIGAALTKFSKASEIHLKDLLEEIEENETLLEEIRK